MIIIIGVMLHIPNYETRVQALIYKSDNILLKCQKIVKVLQ